jgi:hypothetical protein
MCPIVFSVWEHFVLNMLDTFVFKIAILIMSCVDFEIKFAKFILINCNFSYSQYYAYCRQLKLHSYW